MTFRSGSLALAGSFTRPREGSSLPAVVLVSGSGAQDRDGNPVGDAGPSWNIFKSLAYELSRAGVAVLRYDDRGAGKSGGDFETAKFSDFVSDARAGVACLRARPDVDPDRVGIVGHSEGAVVAIEVAGRDGGLRAIFLLAGTGKPLDAVILEQVERSLRDQGLPDAEIREQKRRQSEKFAAIRETEGDWLETEGRRTFVGWLREHLHYDPSREIRRVAPAVAVFQGLKDRQVFPDNADLLETAMKDSGKTNFEVHRLADLDHLFMRERTGIADYADPSRRLDPDFLKLLVERVRRRLGASK